MKKLLFPLFLVLNLMAFGQMPTPGVLPDSPVAVINGTVHVGDGTVIENGYVLFDKGVITAVGDLSVVRLNTNEMEIVDARGGHIYPGLIQLNTTLGLEDISAVRASVDAREVGAFTPNVRSLIAYNTDSWHIPAQRFLGILLAQPTPRGGYLPGTSSVVQLDAWNWEDAAYAVDNGLHLSWPSPTYGPRWWQGETERRDNKEYDDQVNAIDQIFKDAKDYESFEDGQKSNLKLEAIVPVFDGSKTLFISATRRRQIIESVQWAKKMEIPRIVIVGPRDADLCIDFLAEMDIPVILPQIHRLPSRADAGIYDPFELPAKLHAAGIIVAFSYDDLQEARNLPFFAGTAIAHGLDPEAALAMVTSNAAIVLGIDDRTGYLVKGLDANIVISSGDLLDMSTNDVSHAFIQGRPIDLNGPQQQLYEKFKNKPTID